MKTLHINVSSKWFKMFKDGTKRASNGLLVEYREVKPSWVERLQLPDYTDQLGESKPRFKKFDLVQVCEGYPKKTNTDKRLVFRFRYIDIGEAEPGIGRELVGDRPVFRIFMELNRSDFEVKPMTRREAVEDYWKSLKIGDPIHQGSEFYKISNCMYAYQSEPNQSAHLASHYDHESHMAFAYEFFRLDTHEKYKDAV